MTVSSYFDAPDVVLEHATFAHPSGVKYDSLNRLAAILGEASFSSVMKSAPPVRQRLANHDFMARELVKFNRRCLTPSKYLLNASVKI